MFFCGSTGNKKVTYVGLKYKKIVFLYFGGFNYETA